MKRFLSIFALLVISCAHPQVKENEGVREYGLTPAQKVVIEKVELKLNKETILQIVALTDPQVERLKEVLKHLRMSINIDQDMGDFNIDVGVKKEGLKQYDQDATQKTDISPDMQVIP